jgi:hypothetical protein
LPKLFATSVVIAALLVLNCSRLIPLKVISERATGPEKS